MAAKNDGLIIVRMFLTGTFCVVYWTEILGTVYKSQSFSLRQRMNMGVFRDFVLFICFIKDT